jgi:D-alanyl-D-alanine carboxypeptidase (penicillin-binding protein 5/6)
VADAGSGDVLFESGARDPLPPASTTKMMTALLALERASLDEVVTVPQEALAVGEASMGLVPGEQLTLRDLLHGLLLVSANDAALTVAIHVGGSEQEFVALMNERAAALGMANTHFVNPHGLDDPQHLSSAVDLLALALEALKEPEFARIVATPQASVAGRDLYNTNELLTSYDGANGVKTGTTDAAGQCLVASVARDQGQTVVIVLGSADRYAEARLLLDYYFENYSWRQLTLPTDRLSRYEDSEGQAWVLSLGAQKATLLPSWQWPQVLLFRWVESTGHASVGGIVGSARFSVGSNLLAEVPLLAELRE